MRLQRELRDSVEGTRRENSWHDSKFEGNCTSDRQTDARMRCTLDELSGRVTVLHFNSQLFAVHDSAVMILA